MPHEPRESSEAAARVRIGRLGVGDDEPVVIIAEAGVNHNGEVDNALRLVDVAAEARADLVKFQVFRADELATAAAGVAGYQRQAGDSSQREMLRRLELTDDELARVRTHCADRGIEFLATPFSPSDVERLRQLDVPAIKIASTDLNNTPLLREAATTTLPLIVSTGASTREEITACVANLRVWGAGERLVLLHCVSGYPAPLESANLRTIHTIRQEFGVPCGFSDHTRSTGIGGWAVAAGARVLEKHFTLDRTAAGPDHAMSLNPSELKSYIQTARTTETAMGDGTIGMTEIETDVRNVARKSIVAARPIAAGTTLTAEMITVKRPGGGIPPEEYYAVLGQQTTRDLAADAVVTWDVIQ